GALQCSEPAADQELVPASPVLFQKQDRLAIRADSGASTRSLELQERDEAMDFGFRRAKACEHASQPQRLVAQLSAQPVLAGGGCVALVEDQVDHLEHRVEALRQLSGRRQLERYLRRAQGAFR